MTFSLGQLAFIILGYLGSLFLAAYAMERGWLPRSWVRHPVVYIFSLGVYASAWAFYGSVGLAHQYGYGFWPTTWVFQAPLLCRPFCYGLFCKSLEFTNSVHLPIY